MAPRSRSSREKCPGQGAETAVLTDDDPALGHGSEPGAQPLSLANGGDSGSGTGLGAHDRQRSDRVGAADPVGQPCRSWTGTPRAHEPCWVRGCRRPGRNRSRVDASRDCSSATSSPRRFGEVKKSSRSPRFQRRLDEGCPGLLIAATIAAQTTAGLEGTDRSFCGRAKSRRLGAGGGWKPGGTEAALQIAYCLASLTGCQREVGRNSSSSCKS